ncbi:TPA: transcriptional regulator, partial [Salmonella enterica]|nr:transcriptional regulator [Salmonella enterica]
MTGRAANTIPAMGICPPTFDGFERPVTLTQGVKSKYSKGHKMITQLVFKSRTIEAVEHEGKFWFTASTLATALEYADARSVTNIYNRNSDEFTPCMSQVINMITSGQINGLQ